ncbi:MAG: preprotein translocase subunit SecE [Dehalococcoidales bacterium]|nr:preprotein translocase subunit SecE [Dehalococcoidales bacterium]
MTNRRSTKTKGSSPGLGFISDTIAELKKVVWLSRQEVAYLTVLVLIVSITAGVLLGIVDYAFTRLVNDVFIGG